jgi:hypothetical protein
VVVVSVDLAYKNYRDIGIAVLASNKGSTVCEFVRHSMQGAPEPMALARYLSDLCAERQSDLLLLDGPQGWKRPDNGLLHSRVCERKLNTPAKTGLPGSVKPANYGPFVSFSIRVYDSLSALGWSRFSGENRELNGSQRLLVESFPLSAWRAIGIRNKGERKGRGFSPRAGEYTALLPSATVIMRTLSVYENVLHHL